MEKRITYFLLLILFAIGVYLRISGTLGGFFAFTYDQGRDFLNLHQFVYSRDLSLIGPPTGIDGVFHGVWWHWLLTPLFWIFQGNPKWVVASFNILSSGLVFIAFYFGNKMRDSILGLILAAIVAVSPHFVGTGAQLWHPNVVPILSVLLCFCIWQNIKKRWSYFWIAAILGLIFEFELGYAGLFIPAFLIASIVFKIFPRRNEIIASALGFGFWLSPRILFEVRNTGVQTKSLINYIKQTRELSSDSLFTDRLIERSSTFVRVFTETFGGRNLYISIFILLLLMFTFFVTRRVKLNKDYKKFIQFILLIICMFIFIASLYKQALWGYYLIGLPSMLLPVVGYLLYTLVDKKLLGRWILLIVLILFMTAPWSTINTTSWAGDASVYKNQLAVVDEIFQQSDREEFNVQVYSPSVIDYTYQYLFLWRGQTKYGYVPDRQYIQKTVFLIIEPEPWKPVLQEAWLRDREGDGTIVWQKNFPGDIQVEKRIR